MLCPSPIIDKSKTIVTSNETLNTFASEMKTLNFYDFSTGDCHSVPNSYVPRDLNTASKVWLRIDRVRKSLEAPYSGPFAGTRNILLFVCQKGKNQCP